MQYHPFIPKRWSSAAFLTWLKRVHAWTGFWGAAFFLLLGVSGVLLNHRQVMKIETGEPVEVSSVRIAVLPGTIPDADGLGTWAKNSFDLPGTPQPPRPAKDAKGGKSSPQPSAAFAGRTVQEPEVWVRTFNLTNARATFEYVPGANFVTAKRDAIGVLGTIKNLHKGVGLPVAWVLLLDTIAGALIMMSLTGFLLWSRLHGSRLLAGGLAGGAIFWGLAAAVPALS